MFSLSEASELERLLELAGFDEIAVERRARRLRLAPPGEFLWQYVSGTPLAPALVDLDERARTALALDVVARWERFAGEDGSMVMELAMLLATAR